MGLKIQPKGFFKTSNYGVYFYLIGSLLFYFQMIQSNEIEIEKGLVMLFVLILIAGLLVYST